MTGWLIGGGVVLGLAVVAERLLMRQSNREREKYHARTGRWEWP